MKEQSRKLVAPDGGWGWMVCIGSSLITFSLRSLDPSFGLLFGDLLKDLNVETTGASVIMSVLESTLNFSGMLLGPLMKKFSFRKVAVAGSLLSCFGLILTSQANSLTYIICTYSILGGLGTGFATTSSFVSLNSYFREKRTQVVGLSMAGTSLGMLCMPQIVHLLLVQYEFSGTILVIGALALHSVVGACLLQPVSLHLIPAPDEEDLKSVSNGERKEGNRLLKSEETMEDKRRRKISMKSNALETSSLDMKQNHWKDDKSTQADQAPEETGDRTCDSRRAKKSMGEKLVSIFDLKLLTDPIYLNIVFGLSLIHEADLGFKFILPFFLRSIGSSKGDIAFSLSLMAFSDIVARLTMPTIFTKFKLRNRNVVWASSILLAINRSVIAGLMPGKMLIVALVLNGFLRGTSVTNMNLTVSEHCALDVLPSALGMLNVSKGLVIVALGPLVGYIRDATGSYGASIHVMTSFVTLSAVMWGIECVVESIRSKRSKFVIRSLRQQEAA